MRDISAFREFALRDWAAMARLKEQTWLEMKRRDGPAGGIRAGDELRRFALSARPDWPTEQSRNLDHASHLRVLDALRRVPSRGR